MLLFNSGECMFLISRCMLLLYRCYLTSKILSIMARNINIIEKIAKDGRGLCVVWLKELASKECAIGTLLASDAAFRKVIDKGKQSYLNLRKRI